MKFSALAGHLDTTVMGGDPDLLVHAITRDSRQVSPGSLFVAIRGDRVDGHELVGTLPAGSAVLLDKPVPVPPGVSWAVVPDTKKVLAPASAWVFGQPAVSLPVVGVTGTNGKTTVSTLIGQTLEAMGHTVGRVGTTGVRIAGRDVGSALTTPEAPALHGWFRELLDAGGTACVMEVSSIGIAQHRVDAIPFALAVFTMLGRDHLDFHGTEEAYAAAKATLFQRMLRPRGGAPRALLCADDPAWPRMDPPEDRWLFGFDAQADVRIRNWHSEPTGSRLQIDGVLGQHTVQTPLIGRYNAHNVAAAFSACCLLGGDPVAVAAALSQAPGPPGRMESVPNDRGLWVFVDYAHTPDALSAAIASVKDAVPGQVWVVFGCGGDRDRGKRGPMGTAALSADHVVVTSDNPRTEDPEVILDDVLKGIPQGRAWVEVQRDVAIRRVLKAAKPGDAVLIAGKGHERTQEIAGVKRPFDDRAVARAALAHGGAA